MTFARLALLLLLSFVLVKASLDILLFGWIDVRRPSLIQQIAVPLVQAVLVWVVFGRRLSRRE